MPDTNEIWAVEQAVAGSCGQLTARGARTASRPRVGSVRRDEFYEEERDKRMAGMGSRSRRRGRQVGGGRRPTGWRGRHARAMVEIRPADQTG